MNNTSNTILEEKNIEAFVPAFKLYHQLQQSGNRDLAKKTLTLIRDMSNQLLNNHIDTSLRTLREFQEDHIEGEVLEQQIMEQKHDN